MHIDDWNIDHRRWSKRSSSWEGQRLKTLNRLQCLIWEKLEGILGKKGAIKTGTYPHTLECRNWGTLRSCSFILFIYLSSTKMLIEKKFLKTFWSLHRTHDYWNIVYVLPCLNMKNIRLANMAYMMFKNLDGLFKIYYPDLHKKLTTKITLKVVFKYFKIILWYL